MRQSRLSSWTIGVGVTLFLLLAFLFVLLVSGLLFFGLGRPHPPSAWWMWPFSWRIFVTWGWGAVAGIITELRLLHRKQRHMPASQKIIGALTIVLAGIVFSMCLSVGFNVFAMVCNSAGPAKALLAEGLTLLGPVLVVWGIISACGHLRATFCRRQ
jgi:hypothetical protein